MCLFCLLHFGFALHFGQFELTCTCFSFPYYEKRFFWGADVFSQCSVKVFFVLWGDYSFCYIFSFAEKEPFFSLSWVTGDRSRAKRVGLFTYLYSDGYICKLDFNLLLKSTSFNDGHVSHAKHVDLFPSSTGRSLPY